MARRSSASLSMVPSVQALGRMVVPAGLTRDEAALFVEVVDSKPAEWFEADSAPLVKEYVRAACMCDLLAMQIEAVLAEGGEDMAGSLKQLLDMRDKESKRALSTATKLRLTQQSRYTPKAASTHAAKAGSARPWQIGKN